MFVRGILRGRHLMQCQVVVIAREALTLGAHTQRVTPCVPYVVNLPVSLQAHQRRGLPPVALSVPTSL